MLHIGLFGLVPFYWVLLVWAIGVTLGYAFRSSLDPVPPRVYSIQNVILGKR